MAERDERDILLRGMWRTEYSRAKRFFYWGFCLEVLVAIAGVFAIRFIPGHYGAIASLLVAGFATLGFVLKKRYDNIRSYAEEARRAGVFMKALDYRISEKKRTELEKPFSSSAKEIAQQKIEENREYFASTADFGPVKILEMLQESAFWSHSQMEIAAKYAGWISLGFITLVLLALYFMAFVAGAPKQNWTSDLFITFVLLFVTSGIISLRQAYAEIGSKIKRLDDELEAIREARRKPSIVEVFARLNEYDCSLMESSILPNFIYNLNQARLNAEWNKRQEEYKKQIWND